MIKFIKKQHVQEEKISGKVIIYYSISDIFLGTALLLLVAFFIHDYISQRLTPRRFSGVNAENAFLKNSNRSNLMAAPLVNP